MDWNVIFTQAVESAIGAEAVIYALLAIGLNVHFGYTGLLNFGQAAFAAMGAYGLAMGVATFGLPFWLGIPIGLMGGIALALILGIPTLRLRADYLAIVTIAAAEIVRITFKSVTLRDWTGGSDGIQAFADTFYRINPYPERRYETDLLTLRIGFDHRVMWVLTVGWIVVAVATAIVFLLMRSPWGRILKAIREDEDAVRSLGKNVFFYKMQSLMLGGTIGALSGLMFALSRASVQPDNYGTEFTFFAYAIVILGGAARVFGPIAGAAIFWVLLVFVRETLDGAVNADVIPDSIVNINQTGAVVFMLTGLGLVLLLIFRPQGIFGDKREMTLDAR